MTNALSSYLSDTYTDETQRNEEVAKRQQEYIDEYEQFIVDFEKNWWYNMCSCTFI